MSRFLSQTLADLTPYTPGEQPQDQKYIKLNTNENPYPPSPWVTEAVNAEEVEKLRLYSDPTCKELVNAIAARYDIKPAQVMLGNGSDEVLAFALRAFCDGDTPAAFADITYGCYKVWTGLMHIPTHILPLEANFTLDYSAYCGLNETIIIANPNAPTGIALSVDEIEEIVKSNPDNVVIIDEAYVDFGAQSCLPLIEKYDNLLVVQTFSKSHNLAGARIGYAMGSEALIADLNAIKFSVNPYNINRLSLRAGRAGIQDADYFNKCCAAIIKTRAMTVERLQELGFTVLPSKANFVFAKTDKMPGGELYRRLKERGVLVRHFDAPAITEYNRISIGTEEDMKKFLSILTELLAEGEA